MEDETAPDHLAADQHAVGCWPLGRAAAGVPEPCSLVGRRRPSMPGIETRWLMTTCLADPSDRYLQVLEAVEATDGWVTSVRASAPPMTIMGALGGVEAGLRQLRRTRPLEVEVVDLGDGEEVRVPTADETLRIKAYLVVQRNQVRDYLDVVALAARRGTTRSAGVLARIDDFYSDRSEEGDSVLTALVQRLSEPNPRDTRVTGQLAAYKALRPEWHSWPDVVAACNALADGIVETLESDGAP